MRNNVKSFMDMYNGCECNAQKGLSYLLDYLDRNKEFMWTKTDFDVSLSNGDITTVDVEYFSGECGDMTCTEILGTWEFDSKGRLIE